VFIAHPVLLPDQRLGADPPLHARPPPALGATGASLSLRDSDPARLGLLRCGKAPDERGVDVEGPQNYSVEPRDHHNERNVPPKGGHPRIGGCYASTA